jgi:hypothetical protein
MPEPRDRPDVCEVLVTPEMIEAGIAAIRPVDYEFWETNDPEQLGRVVRAVFGAMCAASENGRA